VAYVVPAAASEIQSHTLREFLLSKLPDYMVPAAFVQLEALPLLPNGKVDRRSLPAPEWDRQAADVYAPPTNDLEKAIAKIWQSLLPVDQVGLDDSFFELGGHSLLIVQAHRQLSETIDRELSITDMFRYPTIRALSQYLSQKPDDGGQISVQQTLDRAQARRAAMMQRRQRRRRARKEVADDPR
jgi:acyl carrier protein